MIELWISKTRMCCTSILILVLGILTTAQVFSQSTNVKINPGNLDEYCWDPSIGVRSTNSNHLAISMVRLINAGGTSKERVYYANSADAGAGWSMYQQCRNFDRSCKPKLIFSRAGHEQGKSWWRIWQSPVVPGL